MAIPLYTTGSLSPTFVSAPPVGVAVKLPSAFALFERFPTVLREPLSASDTLSEATAPVKLPVRHCPPAGLRLQVRSPVLQGWYPNIDSDASGDTSSQSPTYPVPVSYTHLDVYKRQIMQRLKTHEFALRATSRIKTFVFKFI